MQITAQQRQSIRDHCLPLSWQALASWRLRHQGAVTDEPDQLLDWLSSATHASAMQVEEMVTYLSEQLWCLQPHPVSPDTTEQGVRALDVVCAGLRWTLWMVAQPQLHLLRISR